MRGDVAEGGKGGVVVHDLAHALATLDAAAELAAAGERPQGEPIVLWSAPAAAASLGVGGFLGLIEAARESRPDIPAAGIIDCGDDPGHALAALRMGLEGIALNPGPAHRAVREIAHACGAWSGPRPEALLDLLDAADPRAAAREWLRTSASTRHDQTRETKP